MLPKESLWVTGVTQKQELHWGRAFGKERRTLGMKAGLCPALGADVVVDSLSL